MTEFKAEDMKIVEARITDMPGSLFDPMPQVLVNTADEKERLLFDFYPDEISFHAGEFVGLTIDQAYQLKAKKDLNYLRGGK